MGLYKLAGPMIRMLSPENAHNAALFALKKGLVPSQSPVKDDCLSQTIWGLDFENPVGLAAGFDKNADAPDALLKQGFGFVEIGSVTPKPQPGNPKPRLFRLSEDSAVINRMGFNNEGMDEVADKLKKRQRNGIVGANIGKNKTQEDAIADYVAGTKTFTSLADYLVVNVSSPNTPGLRSLQSKDQLTGLLAAVLEARNEIKTEKPVPLLLKIAPDLTDEDKTDLVDIACESGIDGMIISNTTIERPDSLQNQHKGETGGLSGQPLFHASTAVLADMARGIQGRIPLVGVGGVSNADQAFEKILNGASLVQLYSALVYGGTELVREINLGLIERLEAHGVDHISKAIGQNL